MKIGIVDYGAGNISSVKRMLRNLAIDQVMLPKPTKEKLDGIILPGVGSFGWAMNKLSTSGMDEFLKSEFESGRKIFGICLGLQLFYEHSQEEEGKYGLGILKGTVKKLESKELKLKVPNIGFGSVDFGINSKTNFYYAHSFYVCPEDTSSVVASTVFGGKAFPAVIKSGSFMGVQFHPELSGDTGEKLFKDFIEGRA